jgi:hypothetical protein
MVRRFTSRIVLVAALIALVVAPTALAGKGGGKPGGGGKNSGGGSLSLVLLDSADAVPNHGEKVTFDVSTTTTDRPFVGLRCWQGLNFVYDGYVGFFPTYMFDPWLTLGSPYWVAGVETSCTARLFYYDSRGNQNVLATLTFAVAP